MDRLIKTRLCLVLVGCALAAAGCGTDTPSAEQPAARASTTDTTTAVDPRQTPDVRGMRFAAARQMLRSRQLEFEWLRAYDRPGRPSSWLVCYQGKADVGQYAGEEYMIRLVLTTNCPETFPSIQGNTLRAAEKKMRAAGIVYSLLDAGDDDFSASMEGVATGSWVVCWGEVEAAIKFWLMQNTGVSYSNDDPIAADVYVARDEPGCSASNEAEEQAG